MNKDVKKDVYNQVKKFKKNFPWTIAWRLKAHSKVIAKFLTPDEEIRYVFAAQKNDKWYDIITTYVIVLTNKRVIMAQKRLIIGYLYTTITPDLFNDLKVKMGLIWGKVYIDTLKELVKLSNIQKSALPEIESNISGFMIAEKKKYGPMNQGNADSLNNSSM